MSRQLPDPSAVRAPVKLAHVVLRTSRLEAMRDWYVDVLGARIGFENPMSVGLSYDEEHHRIALLKVPSPEASPTSEGPKLEGRALVSADVTADFGEPTFSMEPGLEHIAFTFESMGDLLATYRRLMAKGIAPELAFNHGVNSSLYYRDPDGNRIELQMDNWTMEEAREYLTSEVAEKNPLGVAIDPDAWIARYEAGEPISSIVAPVWA